MKNFVALVLLLASPFAFATPGENITSSFAFAVPDAPSFIQGRVLGGQNAQPHSAPYMIQLATILPGNGQTQKCGAVLLNSLWVLTAAHCLNKPNEILVVAGQHDVRVVGFWEQRRSIERSYIHEDYSGSVGPNDIGLIYVNRPFVLDQYVQPTQLPGTEQIPTGVGRLFGWGLTGPGTFAEVLQVIDKPIIDYELCQKIWGGDIGALVDKTNICTGPLDGSTNACGADSGSPLFQFDANGPIVVGIVSWGFDQCEVTPNSPAVYVRVSAFVEWIYRTAGLID